MKLVNRKEQILNSLLIEKSELLSMLSKVEHRSVKDITAAMESVDYKKIGTTPEELWEDFVAEIRDVHNTELAQRQKFPPEKLTHDQVTELRRQKPWTQTQAQAAARKTNVGQGLWQLVQSAVRDRERALLDKVTKMSDEFEGLKERALKTIDRRKRREMKSIEDITRAALDGDIPDQQAAWGEVEKILKSRVSKADGQLGFHQALLLAMSKPSWEHFYNAYKTLPEGERKVVEKVEPRRMGVFEEEIRKRAKKLLDAGKVPTIEQGVSKVCDEAPHLFERHQNEVRVVKGGK